MSAALPGVRVGPLDPEATSQFGQVAQQQSARQLVRLHSQMYPPQLRRALARPALEGHTKAVLEQLDAVHEHVSGLAHENGDPVLPEGAKVVGAAVRGDPASGMVLTFIFEMPSGRVGKWFTPYTPEALSGTFDLGREYTRLHQMREQGLVAFDQEATGAEIYRRQLSQANEEVRRLRSALENRAPEDRGDEQASDTRSSTALAEENAQLRQQLEEIRPRLGQLETLMGAGGGTVPTGGLEEDIAASTGGSAPAGQADGPAAAQDPPFEEYDSLKADQVVARLRADETSEDERRAILEYERSHANRKSVVAAGEESLGSGS